jgi:hypothetical protein
LTFNTKTRRIVSLKKHLTAKKEKRLEKYGYFAKKGKFGYVKKSVKRRQSKKKRRGGNEDGDTELTEEERLKKQQEEKERLKKQQEENLDDAVDKVDV